MDEFAILSYRSGFPSNISTEIRSTGTLPREILVVVALRSIGKEAFEGEENDKKLWPPRHADRRDDVDFCNRLHYGHEYIFNRHGSSNEVLQH